MGKRRGLSRLGIAAHLSNNHTLLGSIDSASIDGDIIEPDIFSPGDDYVINTDAKAKNYQIASLGKFELISYRLGFHRETLENLATDLFTADGFEQLIEEHSEYKKLYLDINTDPWRALSFAAGVAHNEWEQKFFSKNEKESTSYKLGSNWTYHKFSSTLAYWTETSSRHPIHGSLAPTQIFDIITSNNTKFFSNTENFGFKLRWNNQNTFIDISSYKRNIASWLYYNYENSQGELDTLFIKNEYSDSTQDVALAHFFNSHISVFGNYKLIRENLKSRRLLPSNTPLEVDSNTATAGINWALNNFLETQIKINYISQRAPLISNNTEKTESSNEYIFDASAQLNFYKAGIYLDIQLLNIFNKPITTYNSSITQPINYIGLHLPSSRTLPPERTFFAYISYAIN